MVGASRPLVQMLDLLARYRTVRARTLSLAAPIVGERSTIHELPEVRALSMHLAQTSVYFERHVLARLGEASRDARVPRGLMDVMTYRGEIDDRVADALERHRVDEAIEEAIEVGLHREEQHQELLLTDVKQALGIPPRVRPYRRDLARDQASTIAPLAWVDFEPAAPFGIAPYRLASRPISNAEVLAFIGDDGYTDPRHWSVKGFLAARREGWTSPLYWERRDGLWLVYDFTGLRELDPAETACHLSFYEAEAIARWARARLPTEQEWEYAASGLPPRQGHWADDERLHPRAASAAGLTQMFGDVWEWTRSIDGGGVLRGGSCLTPCGHVRACDRNFLAPSARWQMAGLRLAQDGGQP